MSSEAHSDPIFAAAGARWRKSRARLRARALWRAIAAVFSSSLTRRIVALNLGGLAVLVVAFLLLNHFRADIIAARTQSLTIQADVIAAAVAASATVDTGAITVDPEKLLEAPQSAKAAPPPSEDEAIEFSINPERVGPVLHRLVTPTRTRAQIYDRDGLLLLDSQILPPRAPAAKGGKWWRWLSAEMSRSLAPPVKRRVNDDWITNGKSLPEVAAALKGETESAVNLDAEGDTIVSVGVPIQRRDQIRGALLLSTQGGDIDSVIASERLALLRVFLVLAAVMLVLSLALANTIAEPVRKLAEAAERVRRGIRSRQQIPDFANRADEIGHLSGALRDMTQALYDRIDAIESFAADVAHALKNPLTSLRSAVETLPRVPPGPSRERLLDVMQLDVRRLDRLISDISDASRLDAELARDEAGPVDMAALLRAVVAMAAESPRSNGAKLSLTIEETGPKTKRPAYLVLGYDSRLAQVVTNVIDNACSFSRPGGEVRISLSRTRGEPSAEGEPSRDQIVVAVDDEGPGIPPHALERIFERFYTDRPDQGFGQNSGLGLSISRQIVAAHGGRIWAANRPAPRDAARRPDDGEAATATGRGGARFVISLPAIGP